MSRAPVIRINEVGPRDGLQNESAQIPLAVKIELIHRLAAAGLPSIESGAFVDPKRIPQMAESGAVLKAIEKKPEVLYPVLVPNLQGLAAARAAGATEIAVFGSASESFSRKNINCSVAESLVRFEQVISQARAEGMTVRGYVSCALGCPYEGWVEPRRVAEMAEQLFILGCEEISIADTIGVGTPDLARRVIRTCAEHIPVGAMAVHFHDSYGQALANIHAVLDLGIASIDSSVAGLGGCPYAPGATGNVATEDVLYMLQGLGIKTGVHLEAVVDIGGWITAQLGIANRSRAGQAILAKKSGGA